jgi:hypothetical protein
MVAKSRGGKILLFEEFASEEISQFEELINVVEQARYDLVENQDGQ